MADSRELSDAELTAAFRAGDQSAFAAIYDRHSEQVYTYCLSMLRRPADAADVTHGVFVRAAGQLGELERSSRLRPWLLSMARDEWRAADQLRVSSVQDEPSRATAQDLRHLVWKAVDGLGERDRDLMALNLVAGLEGDDLAMTMGIEMTYLDDVVGRMRGRVEKALGALLTLRLGSHECTELEYLVADRDGWFDAEVRARVNRHIGQCPDCQHRRAVLMDLGNLLPGIVLIPPPAELRSRVLDDVIPMQEEPESLPPAQMPLALGVSPLEVQGDPQPVELAKLAVFAGLALIVGLVGLTVSARFEPLDLSVARVAASRQGAASLPTTTTILGTGTTRDNSNTTTTAAPSGAVIIEVSIDTVDFGADVTARQFSISNSGSRSGAFTVESSSEAIVLPSGGEVLAAGESVDYDVALDRDRLAEGEISEVITISWEGGSEAVPVVGSHVDNPIMHNPRASPRQVQVDGGGGCSGIRTTVSVRVRDTSPLDSVVVRWSPDGGATREEPMSDVGGDVYEAIIGPFAVTQTSDVRMVATDELGNAGGASTTVDVVACP